MWELQLAIRHVIAIPILSFPVCTLPKNGFITASVFLLCNDIRMEGGSKATGAVWLLEQYGYWSSMATGAVRLLELYGSWSSMATGAVLELYCYWSNMATGAVWLLEQISKN